MTGLAPLAGVLLALPVVGIGLILVARRSRFAPGLPLGLGLSGAGGAALAALFAFTLSTVPIAPYELGPGASDPVLAGVCRSLYVGFGIGVAAGGIAALIHLLARRLGAAGGTRPPAGPVYGARALRLRRSAAPLRVRARRPANEPGCTSGEMRLPL